MEPLAVRVLTLFSTLSVLWSSALWSSARFQHTKPWQSAVFPSILHGGREGRGAMDMVIPHALELETAVVQRRSRAVIDLDR
eukprot:4134547-Alexandrium_andersonii.AAC.1